MTRAADHHARVTVTHQYDVSQILKLDKVHYIVCMRLKLTSGVRRWERSPQTRQRHGMDFVPARPKSGNDTLPAPCTKESAMDQDEDRH